MNKTITQKTFDELKRLRDSKLANRIEWLNHTGHSEAYEYAGRLFYRYQVKISRNITQTINTSTVRGDTGVELEIVK